MNISVMKRINFCAGHRLMHHGGKCENFHGHNYQVDIYATASQLDAVGRIVDFADLNALFKNWIDEHWDHGFLLHEQDQNGIDAIQQVHPCKAYVLPYNPTAENMARYLLDHVAPKLIALSAFPAVIERIVVWETPTSCAEARVSESSPEQMDSWQSASRPSETAALVQ